MQGRGYPDVSLVAVRYLTIIQGTQFNMYGTSASAPVFAGMISLVNAERERNGKGTVGFINPALYSAQNSGRYNDILSGSNKCCGASATSGEQQYCCASGFETAIGWDPVTGFGSISYINLLAILG